MPAAEPEPYFEVPNRTKTSSPAKWFLIAGSIIVVILVAIGISLNNQNTITASPNKSTSGSSTQTEETSDTQLFFDFESSTASQILDQLVADGYCNDVDPRSGFVDYPHLLESYDTDQLRGCLSSPDGHYIFIWAQQSSGDMQYRGRSDYTSVMGTNWSIEFDTSEDSDTINEVAARYQGTIK